MQLTLTQRLCAWLIGLAAIALPVANGHVPTSARLHELIEVAPAPRTDPAVVALLADHPNAHVLRAVAADIDHDGDLDVVASTGDDTILALWINDGTGHYSERASNTGSSFGSSGHSLAPLGDVVALAGVTSSREGHALAALPDFQAPTASPLVLATLLSASPLSRTLGHRPVRAPPAVSTT